MHRPLKSLSLFTVTLLLAVASPFDLTGTTSGLSSVLAQTPTTQDRKAEAERLLTLGIEQINVNELQAALAPLQQALAIYREIHNRQGEGQTLKNLGKVVDYQQKVLAIAWELKEPSTEASSLAYLGDASASLNDNHRAIEFAQQALTLARETKNSWAEAVALDTLTIGHLSF